MTIGGVLTFYRVRRDHSDRIGVFFIDVPEIRQRGVGFQLRWNGVVYGASVHTPARVRS